MLRILMLMGLAGLTTLTCLPQSNANTPEKPPAAHPTESESKRFYQLSFVVRELENERLINSRSYLIMLRGGGGGQGLIRAGEKVPFASTSGASTQWQQIDVGVGIDCRRLEEVGDRLSLNLTAEISNVTEGHEQNGPPTSEPIIRNNRWESTVIVPINQPTVLFSSDDPASKRKTQLQLTATLLR